MNREKIWIVSVIVAVSSAVICMASIFFSYRVYVSSRKSVTEYRADLSAIFNSYVQNSIPSTNPGKFCAFCYQYNDLTPCETVGYTNFITVYFNSCRIT
jgi:hypothetical protein